MTVRIDFFFIYNLSFRLLTPLIRQGQFLTISIAYIRKKAQVPVSVHPGNTGLRIASLTQDRQRSQPTPVRIQHSHRDTIIPFRVSTNAYHADIFVVHLPVVRQKVRSSCFTKTNVRKRLSLIYDRPLTHKGLTCDAAKLRLFSDIRKYLAKKV